MPLGADYVELISVVDEAEASRTQFGRTMLQRAAEGEQWFAVCLADDDLDATAVRLGLEISAGSRALPDGAVVSWRSAGLESPKREPWLPFFIEWNVPLELHPGRASVEHPSTATGIAWVEVAGGRDRLEQWLGDADVPIRVVDGDPGVRAVGLTTAEGRELVLG